MIGLKVTTKRGIEHLFKTEGMDIPYIVNVFMNIGTSSGWGSFTTLRDGTMLIALSEIESIEMEEVPVVQ